MKAAHFFHHTNRVITQFFQHLYILYLQPNQATFKTTLQQSNRSNQPNISKRHLSLRKTTTLKTYGKSTSSSKFNKYICWYIYICLCTYCLVFSFLIENPAHKNTRCFSSFNGPKPLPHLKGTPCKGGVAGQPRRYFCLGWKPPPRRWKRTS